MHGAAHRPGAPREDERGKRGGRRGPAQANAWLDDAVRRGDAVERDARRLKRGRDPAAPVDAAGIEFERVSASWGVIDKFERFIVVAL